MRPTIVTRSGLYFDFENPTPDMICIEDIAHALSHLCRYTGHTREFYCPTPEQRILTNDLRWVRAGDLSVGDGLLGFDEHPHEKGSAGANRRRFRPSEVTHAEFVKRKVIRLELEDGSTVRASAEHPWLVATKASNNQTWESSQKIADVVRSGRNRYMNRFMDTWSEEPSREAGWLAGIYDGEGHASFNRDGVQAGVAQNPGAVLDQIVELHQRFGYDFSISDIGTNRCRSLQLRGGWRELARLLGTIRPGRLLKGFTEALAEGAFPKQMSGLREPLRVVAAFDEGEDWVAGLSTSTHTYLCEGFGAHNSVGQHSVHVSEILPPNLQLAGLLHDATESYVGDVSRPLKMLLPEYRVIEDRVWGAIASKFGLPLDLPAPIKEADNILLMTEKRDLLEHSRHGLLAEEADREVWRWAEDIAPLPGRLTRWPSWMAKKVFLERFHSL